MPKRPPERSHHPHGNRPSRSGGARGSQPQTRREIREAREAASRRKGLLRREAGAADARRKQPRSTPQGARPTARPQSRPSPRPSSRNPQRQSQRQSQRSSARPSGRRTAGRLARWIAVAVVVSVLTGGIVWAKVLQNTDSGGGTVTVASADAAERVRTPGGILSALNSTSVSTWDPQRMSSRTTEAFATRTFLRTLTAYQPNTDAKKQAELVGDLSINTGVPSKDLKTWTFQLRQGVRWEDGSALTCADVAYGISRSFATSRITGGAVDALAALNIPRKTDGKSIYLGPYATGSTAKKGQKAFDKAVSCKGQKITFLLAEPMSDFNEMLTLAAFAPVKKSKDEGAESPFAIFSSGPYRLEGAWTLGKGGTFVRNEEWDAERDPIRKAYPDSIRVTDGVPTQKVAQDIVEDTQLAKSAVSTTSLPPAIQASIASVNGLETRSVNPRSGLIDYLVPNVASGPFKNSRVRKALAMATNRQGYVAAIGGSTAADPTTSLIPAALPASHTTAPQAADLTGDPAGAKAELKKSGVKTPVKFKVAYRQSATADKAAAALAAQWREAGFEPELVPIEKDYFGTISSKKGAKAYDLYWSAWSPTWASGSTIFPALFDASINLTKSGTGRDYGSYNDKKVTAAMAKISLVKDRAKREAEWGKIDQTLIGQTAYIALAERRSMYISGSGVRNFSANSVLGGVIEFADVAVAP